MMTLVSELIDDDDEENCVGLAAVSNVDEQQAHTEAAALRSPRVTDADTVRQCNTKPPPVPAVEVDDENNAAQKRFWQQTFEEQDEYIYWSN